MKNGILLIIIGVLLLANQIRMEVMANYNYENKYLQLWQLGEKSSSIPAKQKYIIEFLDALKSGKARGEFADNSVLVLKTPNNNFESNLSALQTLSDRLTQIQGMNPSSFEYNTAIQQITTQEQGEASQMLSVFQNCYDLQNYFWIWDWVGCILVMSSLLLMLAGIGILTMEA